MIQIDSKSTSTPLKMPWKKAIAVGRGYEILRTDVQEHLTYLQKEIGYEFTRFHAIFHDDMDVYREDAQGRPIYQWHHVDKILDATARLGLKHILELNPMPAALASGEQTMFHFKANVTPPKCYDKWEGLVRAFVQHVVDRYGRETILDWYFEVWNEPNLPGFWSGTQAEYFKLYEAAASAVKSVDPRFRVGGPASSKCSWLSETIDHCVQNDVPLDFVSSHLYPQDEYVEYAKREGSPHEPGMFFIDTIKAAKASIQSSPLPDLPFLFTEWNTMSSGPDRDGKISWTANPDVDTLYGASMVLHLCHHLDEVLDVFTWWVASDIFEEAGIPDEPFSSTYGLVTVRGTPKATCNAFRLLARMRGPRLSVDIQNAPNLANAVATLSENSVRVLAWNHVPHETKGAAWETSLSVTLPDTLANNPSVQVLIARIKKGSGSAYETWVQMGRPLNPSPMQERILAAHSEPGYEATILECVNGKIKIPFELADSEAAYFEISAIGAPTVNLPVGENVALWDQLMGDRSR